MLSLCSCPWLVACSRLCVGADVFNKFAQSAWGKKLAKRQKKSELTDFERYLAVVAKTKRSKKVRKIFEQLKAAE
jgi:large subunit ribosomal protein L14e